MPWKEKNVVNLRNEFVIRSLEQRVIFQDLCREYGISRKTGYKWQKRFLEDGTQGIYDLSRKPKNCSFQLPGESVCEIIRFKLLHLKWGPKKIRELYLRAYGEAPSLSSCKRVLDKVGLVKHCRRRKQRTPQRLKQAVKAEAPNDIWTVDFKGWWRIKAGKRCEPLTVRDDFSRFILALTAMDSTTTEKTREEFEKVFSKRGVPRIIRSDNGTPFASSSSPLGLTKLSAWWIGLGIELDRIEPGHPEQNGGHERMHRDIRMELQGLIEGDLRNQQLAFDIWRRTFNYERPHEALEMRVPADVYQRSTQPYQEVVMIDYPPDYFSRKIDPSGRVKVHSKHIFISTALSGWNVGLKYVSDHRMVLWFDHLRLGEIDLQAETFIRAESIDSSSKNFKKVLPMS